MLVCKLKYLPKYQNSNNNIKQAWAELGYTSIFSCQLSWVKHKLNWLGDQMRLKKLDSVGDYNATSGPILSAEAE